MTAEHEAALDWAVQSSKGGRVDLELSGELGSQPRVEGFRRFVEHHYLDDGISELVIHLDRLQWIDLEGVGALISLQREAERKGKALTIPGARGHVRDKLRVTGLLDYFEGTSEQA